MTEHNVCLDSTSTVSQALQSTYASFSEDKPTVNKEIQVIYFGMLSGRLVCHLKIDLSQANQKEVLSKFQESVYKIDQIKKKLKQGNFPIDLKLKEVDLNHSDIDQDLFSHFIVSDHLSILSEIEYLDLSSSTVSSDHLYSLHLFSNLRELNLSECRSLKKFDNASVSSCPSVIKVNLTGSSLLSESNWQDNVREKFPQSTTSDEIETTPPPIQSTPTLVRHQRIFVQDHSMQHQRLTCQLKIDFSNVKHDLENTFFEVVAKIDDLKTKLNEWNFPIELNLKEVNFSHATFENHFFFKFIIFDKLDFLATIQKLDFSDSSITSEHLYSLHLFTGLKELNLQGCQNLTLFSKPKKSACPSLKELNIIGSKLSENPQWMANIEKKFPNLGRIDFTTNDNGRFCGLKDDLDFEAMSSPQVYDPCYHIGGKKLTKAAKSCHRCTGEIKRIWSVKFPYSRAYKNAGRWKFSLLDFNHHMIAGEDHPETPVGMELSRVYLHPNCHQIFTQKTITHLFESETKFKLQNCPACHTSAKTLHRIYLELENQEFDTLEAAQAYRHKK